MPAKSTSFRISDGTRRRLTERAARDGLSATALLEQLIIEGIDATDHPGIVHRGPPGDRRAALAAGPDVWEVIARLRELEGAEERRIATLEKETGVHPRLIRVAIEYAAAHPERVEGRIRRNQDEAELSRRAADQRRAILG